MKKIRIITLAALALTAAAAWAVPARRGERVVTLADGTTATVTLCGDEHCHFYLTTTGQVALADADGLLYFAKEDAAGRLVRSERAVTASDTRTAMLADLQGAIERSSMSSSKRMAQREVFGPAKAAANASATDNVSKGVGLYSSSHLPPIGSPRALVILVQYKDVKFTTADAAGYFNSLINEKGFSRNGATGSVSDYFAEASMGQFTPQFDVLGPVTLPQNRSYYGGNDMWGNDQRPEDMVRHAAALLADEVDFSVYDNDGDGDVDNCFIFYAGVGEATSNVANSVWPHSFDLKYSSGGRYKVGNVYFDHYACTNEMVDGHADGIGTFVHEFSHVMGLPDLYTTDYNTSAYYLTPGAYSALDSGPYNNDGKTPPTYSVFERNALGWMDCEVLDSPTMIEMEHILTSNKGYIIPTGDKNEFFLLENRQQVGSDKYIPGHGMLIWHIHYVASQWDNNSVNNSASHQYVDIEEAGGTANSSSATTMARYPFPGAAGKTEFTATTSPAMRTWAGKSIDMPITDITETAGIIRARAAGGEPEPTLDIPEPQTAAVGHDSFTITWEPVDGATDYAVTISELLTGQQYTLETCGFDNSALPDGWTATKKEWYATGNNYGQGRPALKLAANGRYVMTKTYDDPISAVSFWAKGLPTSTTDAPSSISLRAGSNTGAEIAKVQLASTGATYTVDALPEGTKCVAFVVNYTNGPVALDDIELQSSGDRYQTAAGYDGARTGGATQFTATGLSAESGKYAYTVTALGDDIKSEPSPMAYVELATSGIADVAADATDAPAVYYNLQGMRVSQPAAGAVYVRVQGGKATKVIF